MPTAVEEKDAIREVLAEYCFRLDGGRYEEMAALFTENGTWDTAFGKATGRRPIADLARDIRARAGDQRPRAVHLVTNIAIRSTVRAHGCARTGRLCRTARKARKSARAALIRTRWSNKPGSGCSATARSTALSLPEPSPFFPRAGEGQDEGLWATALRGLRLWMWPLSVPAVGSITALISAGLPDASASVSALVRLGVSVT